MNKIKKRYEMHHVEQKMPVKNQCIIFSEMSLSQVESEVHKAHSDQNSVIFSWFDSILKSDRALSEAWQYRIHEFKSVYSVIVSLVSDSLDRQNLSKNINDIIVLYGKFCLVLHIKADQE